MKVCVFASSSSRTLGTFPMLDVCSLASSTGFLSPISRYTEQYVRKACELGEALAAGGHLCINGGGNAGCMGALNEACRKHGGKIRTVIHDMWIIDKVEFTGFDERIIAGGNNLQDRKRLLWEACDCVIVLPGGTGTYDEMWEVAAYNAVGLGNIPVILLNVDGFYDGSLQQLERAHRYVKWRWIRKLVPALRYMHALHSRDGMLYKHPSEVFHFMTDVRQALLWCEQTVADKENHSDAVEVRSRSTTLILRRRHTFILGLILGVSGTLLTVGEAALLSHLTKRCRRVPNPPAL